MLKVGDTLTAKQEFILKYNIPYEDREYKITTINDLKGNKLVGTIRNNKGETYSGYINLDLFYMTKTLNDMIQGLINKEEIKSFNAVTLDGKVINVELT